MNCPVEQHYWIAALFATASHRILGVSEGEPFVTNMSQKAVWKKLYKPSWTPWNRHLSSASNSIKQTVHNKPTKALSTNFALRTPNKSTCSSSRPPFSSPSWLLASPPPPPRATPKCCRSADSAAPTMDLATPTWVAVYCLCWRLYWHDGSIVQGYRPQRRLLRRLPPAVSVFQVWVIVSEETNRWRQGVHLQREEVNGRDTLLSRWGWVAVDCLGDCPLRIGLLGLVV